MTKKEMKLFSVRHRDYYLPIVKKALRKFVKKGIKVAIENPERGFGAHFFEEIARYCKMKGAKIIPLVGKEEHRIVLAVASARLNIAEKKASQLRGSLYYKQNKKWIDEKLKDRLSTKERQRLSKLKESYWRLCNEQNVSGLTIKSIEGMLEETTSTLRTINPELQRKTYPERELKWAEIIKREKPEVILFGEFHLPAVDNVVKRAGGIPVIEYQFRKKFPLGRRDRKAKRKAYYYNYVNKLWRRLPRPKTTRKF